MKRPHSAVRRALLLHLVTSLVVLLGPGLAATLLVTRIVAREVQDDAIHESTAVARGVFAPLVDEGVRAGDPVKVARLDQAVRARTEGSSILRVKIWDGRGRVLYSDVTALIGQRFPLDPDD